MCWWTFFSSFENLHVTQHASTIMSHGPKKTLKMWTHQDLISGFVQHCQVITVKRMQNVVGEVKCLMTNWWICVTDKLSWQNMFVTVLQRSTWFNLLCWSWNYSITDKRWKYTDQTSCWCWCCGAQDMFNDKLFKSLSNFCTNTHHYLHTDQLSVTTNGFM